MVKKWIVLIAVLSLLLAAPAMAQSPEGQEYTVKAGDHLNKIAAEYLGDATKYPDIVDATNLKVKEDSSYTTITDPHVIEVGQKLWIPEKAVAVPEPTAAPTEAQPQRIQFASGATSAQLKGTLPAEGMAQYVLAAQGGQTMTLKVTPGDQDNPQAILVIYGKDGTVLMSDHASAVTWSGSLPSTQDYLIDVRSVVQKSVDYTLDVEIPPLSK